MSGPNDSGDAFTAVSNHIAALADALGRLHRDVASWPDHSRGLRADTPTTNMHPDILARTAVERLDIAAQALTYVASTLDAAWAAAAPLYLADIADTDTPRQSGSPIRESSNCRILVP